MAIAFPRAAGQLALPITWCRHLRCGTNSGPPDVSMRVHDAPRMPRAARRESGPAHALSGRCAASAPTPVPRLRGSPVHGVLVSAWAMALPGARSGGIACGRSRRIAGAMGDCRAGAIKATERWGVGEPNRTDRRTSAIWRNQSQIFPVGLLTCLPRVTEYARRTCSMTCSNGACATGVDVGVQPSRGGRQSGSPAPTARNCARVPDAAARRPHRAGSAAGSRTSLIFVATCPNGY
jgi:hypothetical protein